MYICPRKDGIVKSNHARKKEGKASYTILEHCLSVDCIAQHVTLSHNGGTFNNLYHSFPHGLEKTSDTES